MNLPEVFSVVRLFTGVRRESAWVGRLFIGIGREKLIEVYAECGFHCIPEICCLTDLSLIFCAYWRGHAAASVRHLTKVTWLMSIGRSSDAVDFSLWSITISMFISWLPVPSCHWQIGIRVSAITSGGPTDTEIYYQWGAHWYKILLPVEEQYSSGRLTGNRFLY